MNDLDVFGIGDPEPEQPKQLSLVKRPPSYFEFEPLYTKLLNLKAINKPMNGYLKDLGATITPNRKPAMAPTIEGLTWEHIESMKALMEEKQKAAKKGGKKAPLPDKTKVAPDAATLEAKATAEVEATEEPAEDAAPPKKVADKPKPEKKPSASQQIKEWEKLCNLAVKKGYVKEDVSQYAQRLAPNLTDLTEEHWNALANFVASLQDVSPAALKKEAKLAEERNQALFAKETEDRVWDILQTEIENPMTGEKFTVRRVMQFIAATMSMQETRTNEYTADMNQLNAESDHWHLMYWQQLSPIFKDELARRRRVSKTTGKVYYKPATIKMGWASIKRSPVPGGPKCTDKEGFKRWVVELSKDPEKLNQFLSTLTPEQKNIVQECFRLEVSIDWRACELATEAGVEFPEWKIEEHDPIGEPKLYFSRPRATKPGEQPEEDGDEDAVEEE